MKSFKKGILALGLTLGIIASVGGAAFAASIINGNVGGKFCTGNCFCYRYSARARTDLLGATGYVTVKSVYTYVNPRTLATGTKTDFRGGSNRSTAFTDLYAPGICQTVSISNTHEVRYGGNTWIVTTNHAYN